MDLADLKTTISNLNDEELLNLIRDIRTRRRTAKPKPNAKPKSAPARKANPVSFDALLGSMSPDQLEQLINTLESEAKK